MELIWAKDIEDKDFTFFGDTCKPIVWKGSLFYAYKAIDTENRSKEGFGTKITVIEINLKDLASTNKQISFKNSVRLDKKIVDTKNWKFIIRNNKLFLYVGFLLNLNNIKISIADRNFHIDGFKIKPTYLFGDKVLNYNLRSTFECLTKKTKEQLWKVTVKGFLYTNIEQDDNKLMFGTAGKGGGFYCININEGKILTEYINGDASEYCKQGNSVIIKDKKGNIVQLDAYTGRVINELKLKGKLYYEPMLLYEDLVFATVFDKKNNIATVICVKTSQKANTNA